jgi:hypothetical protein
MILNKEVIGFWFLVAGFWALSEARVLVGGSC